MITSTCAPSVLRRLRIATRSVCSLPVSPAVNSCEARGRVPSVTEAIASVAGSSDRIALQGSAMIAARSTPSIVAAAPLQNST